eukprot:11181578-Lingulodinium_polyedra.AAC.1
MDLGPGPAPVRGVPPAGLHAGLLCPEPLWGSAGQASGSVFGLPPVGGDGLGGVAGSPPAGGGLLAAQPG